MNNRPVLALLLMLGCCIALAGLALNAQAAAGEITLKQARFLLADDTTPPADARDWAPVALPDSWSTTRRDAQGIGWYRTTFELERIPPEGVAVLVRRLSMNGEFFINGVRVHSGGRMAGNVTRNWNTPFFVELAAPLLRSGANQLDIRVFAYRNNNGGLGTVFVGEPATLQARHAFLNALHVKGAVLSFAVTLLAAFIGIVAWLRMGRDPIYGLFGLAMTAWAVRYANYFVQDVPIDPTLYSLVVNSAQGWFFIFFMQFLLRLTNLRWPWAERTLYGMGVLGTVGIYAAFRGWLPLGLVIGLWLCVWIPGSAALLLVSARHAWRTRSIRAVLAALAAWLYVPLTVRELLITSNVVAFDTSYIAHYVGVPLAVLIAWMLVERVVDAARAAAVAEVASAKAVFDERQRITQDMHDGLGLQLNAALRLVERGELERGRFAGLLRGCLDELRLIVDSAASDSGEFLPLLASLRIRLQPKLEAIGIHIDWQMQRFPDGVVLPAGMSMQILRMVQEAINNTIKHANASTIQFTVVDGSKPDHLRLVIRDNGSGFVPENARQGRGLSGMKRRAASVGLGLNVESSAAGTCIQIEIPDLRRGPGTTPLMGANA